MTSGDIPVDLVVCGANAQIYIMSKTPPPKSKSWRESNAVRIALVTTGWLLILGAVAIGPLPGPGPLILAPIGLALILKNSLWAKKRYSRLAKNYPEYGRWLDWAMRRRKVTGRPPAPNIKRDIMHMFRRDDIDQKLR